MSKGKRRESSKSDDGQGSYLSSLMIGFVTFGLTASAGIIAYCVTHPGDNRLQYGLVLPSLFLFVIACGVHDGAQNCRGRHAWLAPWVKGAASVLVMLSFSLVVVAVSVTHSS